MKHPLIYLLIPFSFALFSCPKSKLEARHIRSQPCYVNFQDTTKDTCRVVFGISTDSLNDQVASVTFSTNDRDTTITNPAKPWFWREVFSKNKIVSLQVTGAPNVHGMFGYILLGYFKANPP